jgi:hypothetical protein
MLARSRSSEMRSADRRICAHGGRISRYPHFVTCGFAGRSPLSRKSNTIAIGTFQ